MEHTEPLDPLLPELYIPSEITGEFDMTQENITRLCRIGDIVAQKKGRTWIITRAAIELYKKKPKNGRGNKTFGVNWKGRGRYYEDEDSAEGAD